MISDSAAEELFSIEGIMVAGHPGQIRLLVDQAVIDLNENDVVSASELPGSPDLEETLAQPVRLTLRRGARLLDVGAAEPYRGVVWQQVELFAMRTRREEPAWEMSESFRDLERQFFASYGIIDVDEVDEVDEEDTRS
jgi:hypothetical protein